jgi:phage terminase small subunit
MGNLALAKELRLTEQQRRFAEALAADPEQNQTAAAIAAGVAAGKNAEQSGSRWSRMVKVQNYLAAISKKAIEKAERKSERAVADLAESLAKASDVLRANVVAQAIKEDGSVDIEVLRNAPPGVLKGYKTKSRMERDPDDPTKWTRVEEVSFQAESALAAAKLLTSHYDAAKVAASMPSTQINVLIQRLSSEDLRALEAIALKALPAEGGE